MFYTNQDWDLFADYCDKTEEQRQFVYCMMMDQMVRNGK